MDESINASQRLADLCEENDELKYALVATKEENDQIRPQLKAAQEEIRRLQGFGQEEWRGTLCPECGPSVRVDEDGCCSTCGIDAMGLGVETAWLWKEQRDAWREAMVKANSCHQHVFGCSHCQASVEAARALESGTETGGEG